MSLFRNILLVASVTGMLASAKPTPRVQTSYSGRGDDKVLFATRQEPAADPADNARQMIAWPEPHVNKDDVNNLKASNDAVLYYAENDQDVTQQVMTLDSQDTQQQIVQLELSNAVKSTSCSDNSVTVEFSKKEAFDVAAADWPTHDDFVIISTDPKCGAEHDPTTRDYMLAKNVKSDPETMTVTADIEFVEWKTAFGENAMIHGVIGTYTQKSPARRDIDGTTNFDWDVFPTTPLGAAFAGETGFGLFSDINMEVVCIRCGSKGKAQLTGTFDFSLFSGVEEASVEVTGDVELDLNLGINAKLNQNITLADKELASIPLSPLTIAGIVTVGPKISVSANAGIDLTATGRIIMGANLRWPELRVKGDFAKKSAESSGLDPIVTPFSDLKVSFSATLSAGVPIGIGVGISIASVFDRSLELTATPGLRISGTIDTDPACQGVAVAANLGVPIALDVFAVTTVPITSIGTALFSSCFSLPIDLPTIGIPLPTESGLPAPEETAAAEGGDASTAPAPEETSAPAPKGNEEDAAAPAEGEDIAAPAEGEDAAAPPPETTPAPALLVL